MKRWNAPVFTPHSQCSYADKPTGVGSFWGAGVTLVAEKLCLMVQAVSAQGGFVAAIMALAAW